MAKTEIRDFTKGNIPVQLITFACPLFLSNLLQVVYNMVDMIVVGKVLGTAGLSAVAIGGDLNQLLTFLSMGFANAGQVLIAQYIGANRREKIAPFVGTMSSFLAVCAVTLSCVALFLQDCILRLLNTPAEAYAGAQGYSAICMTGLVFIYGYNVVSAILRGMGDSKHPFIFISIAAVMNLLLDLLFVIKFGLGEAGAALATVISQATSFILCVIFLARHRNRFALNVRKQDFLHWDRELLGDLVRLGFPMAIKTASIQFSKLFVSSWLNSYGVAVSAFSGIAHKINKATNQLSNAMNTAGATMVGQNIAAGEFDRVKKTLGSIARITLTLATLLSLLFILFPEEIFALFTEPGDTAVLAFARGYVPIAVLRFLAAALRAIMNALINGSGNHRINFFTAILDGIVLRIGLALLFGVLLDMKHIGFWLGDALAGFTPFWIGLVFYLSGHWKNSKIKQASS